MKIYTFLVDPKKDGLTCLNLKFGHLIYRQMNLKFSSPSQSLRMPKYKFVFILNITYYFTFYFTLQKYSVNNLIDYPGVSNYRLCSTNFNENQKNQ